jgi:hypothetical protein
MGKKGSILSMLYKLKDKILKTMDVLSQRGLTLEVLVTKRDNNVGTPTSF